MRRPITQVACGVLIDKKGRFLLGSRPEGKPCAGFWEFPGGKLEPGETPSQALSRELKEELGLTIGESFPWFVMEHDYPHGYVRLHFRRCFAWEGAPRALEHQEFVWIASSSELAGRKNLPMNPLIAERVALPDVTRLTGEMRLENMRGLIPERGVILSTSEAVHEAASAGLLYAVASPGSERLLLATQESELPLYVFGRREELNAWRKKGAHGVVVAA